MKTIKIPMADNPIEIIINNRVYVYRAGETVTVPDEVAAAIEQIYHMAPGADNRPPAPEVKEYPYDVVIKMTYDTSDDEIDTSEDPEILKGDILDISERLEDGDPIDVSVFSITEGDDGIVFRSFPVSAVTEDDGEVTIAITGYTITWDEDGVEIEENAPAENAQAVES